MVDKLTLGIVVEPVLIHFDCDASAFLQAEVKLTVLVDADVSPGPFTVFAWTIDDNSLSVK